MTIDPDALAVLGDSLTRQNGLGPAEIKAALITDGWASAKVEVSGITSRTIVNGSNHPTSQETITAWRVAGFNPQTFLVALGSNNQGVSVASNMTAYRTLLAAIGPGCVVYFIGTGYFTQSDCAWAYNGSAALGSRYTPTGPAGSPNAAMLNVMEQGTNPATEATVVGFGNWNSYGPLRSVADPTTVWKMDDHTSPTGGPRHMLQSGYRTYRIPYYVATVHPALP